MRVHIDGDIFISGSKGYDIEKRVIRNIKDPKTKEVKATEIFDQLAHYVTFGGALNGLLHQKIVSLPDEKIIVLEELYKLIVDHKEFIESKLGGIKA